MASDTNVLVIGAGPIGLINAWGMKQLNPELKIVVLEKYEEYQRKHTLIMQAAKLEALMKATQSESNETLLALLDKLKKDPHIRTNRLQEIFTKLAQDSGIEIKTNHAVDKNTIKQTINNEYHNVNLIIGADGTHSVVSDALFPAGNQVKHEFDFVLQLRFEIEGKVKASKIAGKQFYQQMMRHGLIANEYVGHFENGKTPVTMQMMISKKDFNALKKATSKYPLKPYAASKYDENKQEPKLRYDENQQELKLRYDENQQELKLRYDENQQELKDDNENLQDIVLPSRLKSFLTAYFKDKIETTNNVGQLINKDSVGISVNEAPATYAKKVVNPREGAYVVLMGDAALGLSYFKGLNAGLEASARFLSTMSSVLDDSSQNKEAMDRQLQKYQTWFLKDFSPRKVEEVSRYSFWRIRSFMQAMRVVRSFKNASMQEAYDDHDPVIMDYFNHVTTAPLDANPNKEKWEPFPHRKYKPVKFGQFDYVPLKHTAKKIVKIFADCFKPYKSNAQMIQDFKQPLAGIGNFFVGLGKAIAGVFTLNFWIFTDGLFSTFRGIIELITTPLAWIIKPTTRGIATLINGGDKKIEENRGMKKLAQYGLKYLNEIDDSELEKEKTIYELLAVCNDMHRKFEKSISRGQDSKDKLKIEEALSYSGIRSDDVFNPEKVRHYFSLFASGNEELKNKPKSTKVNSVNNSLS